MVKSSLLQIQFNLHVPSMRGHWRLQGGMHMGRYSEVRYVLNRTCSMLKLLQNDLINEVHLPYSAGKGPQMSDCCQFVHIDDMSCAHLLDLRNVQVCRKWCLIIFLRVPYNEDSNVIMTVTGVAFQMRGSEFFEVSSCLLGTDNWV